MTPTNRWFTIRPCPARIEAAGSRQVDPLTHFIVVRSDIPTGIASAQIGHAAGESSPGSLPEGTYCIVLAAKDEPELIAVEAKLRSAGVGLRAIRESDPPYSGQLMALGLTPIPKSVGRRYLSCLPCYRGGVLTKKAA